MVNPFEIEDGCYGLFDILEETDVAEAQTLWNETEKDCKQRAKKVRSYWYSSSCCHDSIDLISAEKFNERLKKATIVDIKKLAKER